MGLQLSPFLKQATGGGTPLLLYVQQSNQEAKLCIPSTEFIFQALYLLDTSSQFLHLPFSINI